MEKNAGEFDSMTEEYRQWFEDPDILFIFRLMAASVLHAKRVMKFANQEHTLEDYANWIQQTIRLYQLFEKDPDRYFRIEPAVMRAMGNQAASSNTK